MTLNLAIGEKQNNKMHKTNVATISQRYINASKFPFVNLLI